jgi:hypothetical protein
LFQEGVTGVTGTGTGGMDTLTPVSRIRLVIDTDNADEAAVIPSQIVTEHDPKLRGSLQVPFNALPTLPSLEPNEGANGHPKINQAGIRSKARP